MKKDDMAKYIINLVTCCPEGIERIALKLDETFHESDAKAIIKEVERRRPGTRLKISHEENKTHDLHLVLFCLNLRML